MKFKLDENLGNGIVVIRVPRNPSIMLLEQLISSSYKHSLNCP